MHNLAKKNSQLTEVPGVAQELKKSLKVFFIKFAFLNTSAIMYDVYMSGENFYKDIYILLIRKLNS